MDHSNTKTIGQALAASMASAPPCEKFQIDDREIVAPTSPEESRALREWAMTQPTRWPAIEVSSLTRHLEFMTATLPSKNVDEEGGRKRVAVYARILGAYSEHAVASMALIACSTLKWFPTPAECLEIIAKHVDPPTPRDRALAACHGFAQRRFEAFRETIRAGGGTPDLLATVPDQWKRICVEQGFLNWTSDGGFAIATRYAAPTNPTQSGE